jgi:hypothetical protein
MRERVAKAIAATYERDDITGELEPWKHHLHEARAAIEAVEAGHFIVPHNDMRRLISELATPNASSAEQP